MEHGGKGSNSYEYGHHISSGNGNKQHLPPPQQQHASTNHNQLRVKASYSTLVMKPQNVFT